jgi:hypothetical protein
MQDSNNLVQPIEQKSLQSTFKQKNQNIILKPLAIILVLILLILIIYIVCTFNKSNPKNDPSNITTNVTTSQTDTSNATNTTTSIQTTTSSSTKTPDSYEGWNVIDFKGYAFYFPEEWKVSIADKTENDDPLENTYLFFDREQIKLYPMLYPETHIYTLEGDQTDDILPKEEEVCQTLPDDYKTTYFTFKKFTHTCDGDYIKSTYYHYVMYDSLTNLTLHIQFRITNNDTDFIDLSAEFVSKVKHK